jgi:hypothetical protein
MQVLGSMLCSQFSESLFLECIDPNFQRAGSILKKKNYAIFRQCYKNRKNRLILICEKAVLTSLATGQPVFDFPSLAQKMARSIRRA